MFYSHQDWFFSANLLEFYKEEIKELQVSKGFRPRTPSDKFEWMEGGVLHTPLFIYYYLLLLPGRWTIMRGWKGIQPCDKRWSRTLYWPRSGECLLSDKLALTGPSPNRHSYKELSSNPTQSQKLSSLNYLICSSICTPYPSNDTQFCSIPRLCVITLIVFVIIFFNNLSPNGSKLVLHEEHTSTRLCFPSIFSWIKFYFCLSVEDSCGGILIRSDKRLEYFMRIVWGQSDGWPAPG